MHARLDVSADEVVDLSPRGTERAAWAPVALRAGAGGARGAVPAVRAEDPGGGSLGGARRTARGGIPPRPVLPRPHGELRAGADRDRPRAGRHGDVHHGGRGAAGGARGGESDSSDSSSVSCPTSLTFDLDDPIFVDALRDAGLGSATALGIAAAGTVLAIKYLPRAGLHRRIAVREAVTATSAGDVEARSAALLGQRGEATEALHPSGTVADRQGVNPRPGRARRLRRGRCGRWKWCRSSSARWWCARRTVPPGAPRKMFVDRLASVSLGPTRRVVPSPGARGILPARAGGPQ